MANLNLSQDVANKRERKQIAVHIVAKYDPLQQTAGMRRYSSLLINIEPSALNEGNKKTEAKAKKLFVISQTKKSTKTVFPLKKKKPAATGFDVNKRTVTTYAL